MSCQCESYNRYMCAECREKLNKPTYDELKSQLAIAEKKLELAIVGLGMIRELDRFGEGVPPKEVSDYEQGMGSGFEIAAEIAATTVMEIEAMK